MCTVQCVLHYRGVVRCVLYNVYFPIEVLLDVCTVQYVLVLIILSRLLCADYIAHIYIMRIILFRLDFVFLSSVSVPVDHSDGCCRRPLSLSAV